MFMGALIMNPNITFGSIEKLSDFGGAWCIFLTEQMVNKQKV
jgi:hypothetical protein